MVKRCLSLLLSVIVCFTFAPAIVVSATTDDKTNATLENLTYKIPVTEEYMEKVFGAPEEILDGSTEELLDYFLNSMFLRSVTFPLASSDSVTERQKNADFTAHAAFRELLTRSDLIEALANRVRNIYFELTTDEYTIELLRNLAAHIPDEVIATATETDEERTPASNTEYFCSSCGLLGTIWKAATDIPEDILEGSTEELLNYYRETYDGSACNHITHSSAIGNYIFYNFYKNEVFDELLTRSDLGDALLKNLTAINNGCYVDEALASSRNSCTSADEQIKKEENKSLNLVINIPDTTIITTFANTDDFFDSASVSEPRASVSEASAAPYTEINEAGEIVVAFPVSISSVVVVDDESED